MPNWMTRMLWRLLAVLAGVGLKFVLPYGMQVGVMVGIALCLLGWLIWQAWKEFGESD